MSVATMMTACGWTSDARTTSPSRRACSKAIVLCSWGGRYVRRAIVSGADGFLGRHLVQKLQQQGVQTTTLTRKPRPDLTNYAMGDAPWSPTALRKIVEKTEPDAIFHLVGGV